MRKMKGKYKPEWHFVGKEPTDSLMEALDNAGIPYVIYGK
jgi:hypothetical protein